MPMNNTPDSLEARVIDLASRVKALETAPLLNSAATKGNITVNPPGQIQFNPTGTGVTIASAANPFGGSQAQITFTSQFAGVTAPFIAMQDNAGGGFLYMQNGPASKYTYFMCTSGSIQMTNVSGSGANYTTVVVNDGNVQISFPSLSAGIITFFGDGTNDYIDFGSGYGRILANLVPEIRIVANATTATYIAIRASAFTVSSARSTKEEIHDLPWKALDILDAAPVQRWRYKEEHAGDRNFHISPMADDLPPELVIQGPDGELDVSVDQRDLVGVLWQAVRELRAEVAELREELQKSR